MRLAFVVFGLVSLLAGCGFQLRGSATLPFESIYIEGAGQEVGVDLERAIRPTQTQVVDTPERAQAILQILSQGQEKQILTLSGAGRVSEYRLIYRIGFRVRNPAGKELLAPQQIELRRDMTYDDTQVLSKDSEQALLYHDMESDAVQQIIRRLKAAKVSP
jgi:LPS-assembly lipoprotein